MTYRGFPTDLERVVIYLRKSREDQEAEERARREGRTDIDTLTRHRNRLLEIARVHRYNITAIYEEVVSGELIDERPEVIRLLNDVENGLYNAVLCIDIDRLGRGDMADQGIIQRVFRDAETFIITEDRIYDLQDDNDEEQVEFKAFFARRELKRITKRMQNGRRDSVKEGNYIGTYEPYGYYRNRNKGLILLPSERAPIVKLIFEWYVHDILGAPTIADRLNDMGLPSPSNELRIRAGNPPDPKKKWTHATITAILKNEIYIGRIQWGKTRTVRKRLENGRYKKVKSVDRPREEWLDREGKHEPLIDEKLFYAAQEILANRNNNVGSHQKSIKNALRGIVVCRNCGSKMQLRPYKRQASHLICPNRGCNRSSQYAYVEEKLLDALRRWYEEYKIQYSILEKNLKREVKRKIPTELIEEAEKEIAATQQQKDNLHTFLERGIYDADTFLARNKVLMETLQGLQQHRDSLLVEIQKHEQVENAKTNIIPMVRHVLGTYHETNDPKERNHLLKQVIEKAEYFKDSEWVDDEFELNIYPKLPK